MTAQSRTTWDDINASKLARFFSSGLIREFTLIGPPKQARLLAKQFGLRERLPKSMLMRDFFDHIYKVIYLKQHRSEYVYKNIIAQRILLGTHSLNTSCMLTEFRVGKNKADAVILNGTSVVYEVKSERDSLSRLAAQVAAYQEVFDEINVVCGECHVEALTKTLPSHVGISVLTSGFNISKYRKAESNLANVSPSTIFESLRRQEYLGILREQGIEVPRVPNSQIHALAKEQFVKLSPEVAHSGMVCALKSRYSRNLKGFIAAVPDSLKSVAVSIKMTRDEQKQFLALLNSNVGDILKL